MKLFFNKFTKKAGLEPGTLMPAIEKKAESSRITVVDFDEKKFTDEEIGTIEESFPLLKSTTTTWINIENLNTVPVLEKLGQNLELHPLILEDIHNTSHRPKFDDLEKYLFIVLAAFSYNKDTHELNSQQISLLLGKNLVFSFKEHIDDLFAPIRERIKNSKWRTRKLEADYLLYSLVDIIIDYYFVVLEELNDGIEEIEIELLSNPTHRTLNKIYTIKHDLIMLRKSIWPLREVVVKLERSDSTLIKKATKLYIRDLYEHTIQILDTIETHRDMVSGMIDIYLSSVSNRMNEIMKVLTIIATIFIPLTFIAGIYGMNFKYMPELEWEYGYIAVWILFLGIGMALILFFRKKKWL
ncbi:MAG: magnesium/cobalt transporter CorA [bacterium]